LYSNPFEEMIAINGHSLYKVLLMNKLNLNSVTWFHLVWHLNVKHLYLINWKLHSVKILLCLISCFLHVWCWLFA